VVQDESAESSRPAASVSRALLLGGVATACVLGAGVGLWARPSDVERPGAPKIPPAAAPAPADRRLAIVVDDSPAPVGKPLDVLAHPQPRPAVAPAAPPQAAEPQAQEPIAPSRPPNGLLRVVAHVPGALAAAVAPPHKTPPAAESGAEPRPPRPAPILVKPVIRKPAAVQPPPAPVEAAPKPVRRVLAAAPPTRPAARLAKQERPRTETLAAKGRPHAPHRAHETEMAATPARPKPPHGLGALAHAFAKLAPHRAKPETPQRAEAAPLKRRKAAETRLAKAERPRIKPPPKVLGPATLKAAQPIRVANVQPRCASSDPGEALACGDPGLSAAQRRLERAYADAEAAGVPASTLERQQQRWRSARAAAAREAPWAVRQVYQARIAELQDQARDARGN